MEIYNKFWNKESELLQFCTNCKKKGHFSKACPDSILSYGIIAFKINDNITAKELYKLTNIFDARPLDLK